MFHLKIKYIGCGTNACPFLQNGCVFSVRFESICRYDAAEVEAPPPLKYDSSIDERELSVEQWREALWEEVINWQPHPGVGLTLAHTPTQKSLV